MIEELIQSACRHDRPAAPAAPDPELAFEEVKTAAVHPRGARRLASRTRRRQGRADARRSRLIGDASKPCVALPRGYRRAADRRADRSLVPQHARRPHARLRARRPHATLLGVAAALHSMRDS
jgi:hypothetical protein